MTNQRRPGCWLVRVRDTVQHKHTHFPTRPCKANQTDSQGKRKACDGKTGWTNKRMDKWCFSHTETKKKRTEGHNPVFPLEDRIRKHGSKCDRREKAAPSSLTINGEAHWKGHQPIRVLQALYCESLSTNGLLNQRKTPWGPNVVLAKLAPGGPLRNTKFNWVSPEPVFPL